MKKIFLSIMLCMGLVVSTTAQDLNKFQYVKVPEKFEFLKEENQYQLNALTAFLFEKYGFETLYKKQIPGGVDPCDILTANVQNDSNLFRSKVYVTLTDCKNNVVFTSQTGTSREKDFKVSYQEALREAFVSIENLKYTRAVVEDAVSKKIDSEKEKQRVVVVDPVVTAEDIEEIAVEEVSPEAEVTPSEAERNPSEAGKIQKFSNGPIVYVLEQTPAGFDLFKEGEQEKFASLMKSGGGENYLYSSKNVSGNAFFDRQGNLIVEYLDPNSQQLVSIHYKLKAQ